MPLNVKVRLGERFIVNGAEMEVLASRVGQQPRLVFHNDARVELPERGKVIGTRPVAVAGEQP